MLMSMNVFHQTTPKLLSFPSASFHGRRRRIPHSSFSHALVSSPATAVKFKPKFLHFHGIQHSSCKPVLASPAAIGFNPKSLLFLPCHGISHSPETMKKVLHSWLFVHMIYRKFSPVLSALPRDNQEFSSDNEEEPIIQEHDEEHRSCEPFLASPATMELHPKFLHFLPCHGFSHSSCKPVLGSPATMRFSPVLFALPRDNEEEPIIQEDNTSIFPDDVHKEQSKKVSGGEVKKVEFVVREVTNAEEYWASARLKAEENYHYDPHVCDVDSCKRKNAKQEFDKIWKGYGERFDESFMCIIAVRKEGENVLNGMLGNNVTGTLNFEVSYMYYLEGKTYPEKLVNAKMPSIFREGGSEYGLFTRVAVDKSARKQGVGKSMLKFVIEHAKENGIPQIFLHVRRDNKPALALYEKMGFMIMCHSTLILQRRQLSLFINDGCHSTLILHSAIQNVFCR